MHVDETIMFKNTGIQCIMLYSAKKIKSKSNFFSYKILIQGIKLEILVVISNATEDIQHEVMLLNKNI